MNLRDTLALVSAHVYSPDTIPTGVLPPGVTRLYLPSAITQIAERAGFIAEAYRNELTGETYLSYSGTRLGNVQSALNAGTTALGLLPNVQLTAANQILAQVNALYGPVFTTGHSEGGLLAALQKAMNAGDVTEAYAFNAPGAKPFLSQLNLDPNGEYSGIFSLIDSRDPVARWFDQRGGNSVIGNSHIGNISLINTEFNSEPLSRAEVLLSLLIPPLALFTISNTFSEIDRFHGMPSMLLNMGVPWNPSYQTFDGDPAIEFPLGPGLTPDTGGLESVYLRLFPADAAVTFTLDPNGSPAAVGIWDGGASVSGAIEEGKATILAPDGENWGDVDFLSVEQTRGEAGGGIGITLTEAGSEVTGVHVRPDHSGSLDAGDGSSDEFPAGTAVRIGGPGPDQLVGDDRPNIIIGAAGDDVLYGNGGVDRLFGGPGNDTLAGGSGVNWLFGGDGGDTYVVNGLGNDHIVDDDLTPDDRNVDTVRFTPDIAPYMVQVYWQQGDIVLRVAGQPGSTKICAPAERGEFDDDCPPPPGDDSNRGIERVEFYDGTVWTWEDILKLAEPLPPGDPLGDSGPPPDDLWQIVSDLQHPYIIPTTWPALNEIIAIWGEAETINCPIVLDLDGNGVETRGVNAGAHFDHAGDGFKERTGWAAPTDGLLAWDRNGDGQINGGSELFGNRTLLPDGVTRAANGFAALAARDANSDGKIDANDPIWASLRIWRDANSDGVSTPAELATLTDLGITAINTGYTASSTVDAQGNEHRQIGGFTKADGSTGAAEDIWFKTDTVHANAPDPVPVPADVAALPDLHGFGTLYSLRQAMARDTAGTLKGFVAAFVAEENPPQREALVDQVLFRWAGADTVDPASRGLMDARQLTVIEALMGQGFVGMNGTNPNANAATLLTEAYGQLREWTYAQLEIQTHLADLYRLIDFSWDEQKGLVGDLAPVKAELEARLAVDPVAGQRDLSEFARSIVALEAEDMLGFWAFRDAFAAQDPSLQWVIDLGGRNQLIGTPASEGLNGTSLRDAIRGGDGNDTLWGQQGADVLYGDAGTDLLWGGPGDDLLVGGVGDDTLNGEGGRDRLEGGDGNDWIYAGAHDDVLLGGAGDDYQYGGDGNDTLLGGGGNDTLFGDNGADTFDGGGGNDWAYGGAGADTYLFGRGSGTLSIRDDDTTPGVIDTIQLGPGILPSDVTLRRQPGYDVHLAINGTTDQLGVQSFFWSETPGNQIEQIRFDDGTVWDLATIMQMVLQPTLGDDVLTGYSTADTISGLDGNDQLYGRDGNDTLDGGPGNDSLYGENGDDTLLGGTGDDQLHGGAGADTLLGGAGNDSLYGEAGADTLDGGGGSDYVDGGVGPDTYLFGRGSGSVTIRDDDYTPGVIDTIQLGPGILPSDVTLRRWPGYDLHLAINGATDQLGVWGFFWSETPGNQIEQIRFEDGTIWDLATIMQKVLQPTVGDDVLTGYSTADTISGLDGNDQLFGRAGNDTLDGGPGNDTLFGEDGDDTLLGGVGNDTLYGGNGADAINGGGGSDYAEGGPGGDTYVFGRGSGSLSLRDLDATAGVVDTVQLGPGVLPTDVTIWRSGDHLQLKINDTGETLGVLYFFYQDIPDNQIEQIRFENGTTWDVAAIKQMMLTGTAGADTLIGYASADTLQGLDGNDMLWGRAGDDRLDGGLGADTMYGEGGNDTYVVDNAADVVVETAGNGTDTVESAITYTLPAEAENLVLAGSNAINGTGNALANVLTGNSAANILTGGAGDDTYVVGVGDSVVENANEGTDTVQSAVTFTLPANVETLVLTGMAAINGTGNTLNNSLIGNSAANVLNGGTGADTMAGGAGNDTYVVDNGGDAVVENVGEGTDTVQSAITYTLPANVENLTLTASFAINATGNALANTLTGNSAANVLTGGAGDDIYVVGAGDTVIENAGEGTDTVQSSVTFTLPNNVENLVLTGTSAINGTGNALDNSLTGNTAANILNGGAGADSMVGGAGNDIYVVDNAGDVVTEAASAGIDTVQSAITYTLPANVENLTLTGSAAINGTGNALANTLTGNTAANVLTGGAGNDIYVVDNVGDVVVENLNEGTDTVQSSITYTLTANVENLTLTGAAAINGTGNALANTLTGNSAANVLAGGAGNDVYIVGAGDSVIENPGEGTDTVQSSVTYTLDANVENLTLTGTLAINGTGNPLGNVLTGNTAANVLTGAAGNDTYVVGVGDTVIENAAEGNDTIQSAVTYTLSANVENLTLTGTSAINGTGNALDNLLTGNSAANVLTGGAGNDTYVVGAGDTVFENAGEGTDTIQSAVIYTLSANVENLTLTGSSAINGTGNALDNVLTGNAAANVLTGGAGNDTYIVGTGDTAVENAGEGTDTVQSSVTFTLGSNVENLVLTGTSAINGTGNSLANTLTGNGAANTLTGGTGNDTYVFNPGWGQDTIVENDSTAGNTDTALFGGPVRPLDLVLSRAVNNLAIALHGSTDKATVQSWYSGTAYQTEVIQAGDGSRLLSNQVDQLIQAMASYTASTGLTWDQAIDQRPQEVQAVLAGYWQPPS